MAHPNARLTPHGRRHIIRLWQEGYSPAMIAVCVGVSRATVYKWIRRFETGGEASLADRSCRPVGSPTRVTDEQERRICERRIEQGCGPRRLANDLEMAASTDRKSTRLNSSHIQKSRMPSSA